MYRVEQNEVVEVSLGAALESERSMLDVKFVDPSGASHTTHFAACVHHCSTRRRSTLRDVQEAASHADPRTTMRYDRARGSLDRHATYIVATYLAGATT
jgi:hypothetical protein